MTDKEGLLHEFTEDVSAAIVKFAKLGLKVDDFIFVLNFIIAEKLDPESSDNLVEEKATSAIAFLNSLCDIVSEGVCDHGKAKNKLLSLEDKVNEWLCATGNRS